MADRPSVRLSSLTSLRWFAALWVFFAHVDFVTATNPDSAAVIFLSRMGSTGVSFFFVLSGFVLTWSHVAGDRPVRFYRRRFARVVPAYWAAALIAVVVMAWTAPVGAGETLERFIPLTLLQSWVPVRDVYWSGAGVGWSLSTEVVFYAVFPAVILVVARLTADGAVRAACALVVCVLALPLLLPVTGVSEDLAAWVVGVAPPVRLAEFVLGMLLAAAVAGGVRVPVRPELAALIAFAATVAAGTTVGNLRVVAITLVPFALLLMACAQRDADADPPAWLHHRALLVLGQWSYAFYLVHILVLMAVGRAIEGADPSAAARVALLAPALALAILAASALFRFVEYPLERRLRGAPGSATPHDEVAEAPVTVARALT